MLFIILSLAVLLAFYAIYFGKALSQRRRGIQTRQLGKGKTGSARRAEVMVSLATFAIVPAELLSIFLGWNSAPTALRWAGAALGMAGDLVFLIAVITMQDSWRAGIPSEDKTTLVSDGIFKYSRNPAFLGFDLTYIGILLMHFNFPLLLFTLWAILALHMQILQEEKFLSGAFGAEYTAYKARTGRYLGKKC